MLVIFMVGRGGQLGNRKLTSRGFRRSKAGLPRRSGSRVLAGTCEFRGPFNANDVAMTQRSPDGLEPHNSKSIKLTIAYEGTKYAGWQIQPDQPSVQGTIEKSLEQLTAETVRIHGAGRTDAGVHAIGQVAHFSTRSTIPPERFAAALNSVLPRDIVVRHSAEVPAEFHARYSAVRKQYRYLIDVSSRSLPWLRHLVWRRPGDLDVRAMNQAAQQLVGRHDFRSFESKSDPAEDSVRTVFESRVHTVTGGGPWPGEGSFIAIEMTADGFLYNMVRTIVGTLVKVGLGQWTDADVRRILATGDRSLAGPTAPPQGLYLVRVDYDEADALPPQSQASGVTG